MVFKLVSRRGSPPRTKLRHLIYLLPITILGFWWGYKQFKVYFAQPEAILVLGGHEEREIFAARLAAAHPNLPIWVSSGSPSRYVKRIFAAAGVKSDRLHLDYQAKDTVTNFTTLVDEFKARGIDSVYLVTSENHLKRALLIGEIVFGSRGIIIKPVAVDSQTAGEPVGKCFRDGARALLWVITGSTGEKFVKRF